MDTLELKLLTCVSPLKNWGRFLVRLRDDNVTWHIKAVSHKSNTLKPDSSLGRIGILRG